MPAGQDTTLIPLVNGYCGDNEAMIDDNEDESDLD